MTRPDEAYCRYLENLTPETLARLGDYVTDDVRFKDPFNDVRGRDAMRRVFIHMFETLGQIRFTVHHAARDDDTLLIAWRFESRLRALPWAFDGTSVVRFAADGRVREHIDHWDAASDFYERLPLIGWLLARLRARVAIR